MTTKRPRRARGDGSVFLRGNIWWVAYYNAAGERRSESTESTRKGDATRLLTKRNGSREHNLPIVRKAEKLTFEKAAQALITEYVTNRRKSLAVVRRRIEKHLMPVFGGKRLASITTADVTAYVAHRMEQGIVNKKGVRTSDVSPAEINRELQALKRIFNLAIAEDRIAMRPKIKLLKESAARSGFFEREQLDAVLAHLPAEIRPVVAFAYHTGWRIHSEVLPLQWRQVDFAANEIRLDAGSTKNKDGRVIYMSAELRQVLNAQQVAHEQLKASKFIFPNVFWRMVADRRGGEKKPRVIVSFNKAWHHACRLAGCPGRIPHDLRRTAVRNYIRAGIIDSVAMKLTGHKTRSVFDRYNIVSDVDLKDAAVKMNVAAR